MSFNTLLIFQEINQFVGKIMLWIFNISYIQIKIQFSLWKEISGHSSRYIKFCSQSRLWRGYLRFDLIKAQYIKNYEQWETIPMTVCVCVSVITQFLIFSIKVSLRDITLSSVQRKPISKSKNCSLFLMLYVLCIGLA